MPRIWSYAAQILQALALRRLDLDCDRIPMRFEDVPLGKICNWIRAEASVRFKPARPWGMPTHLQIEPANVCDLRCALCPVTGGLERPPVLIDPDLFRRLIDEVCAYVMVLMFWEWGEPFVHPHIYDLISYASQRGIKVITSTNGHKLSRPENAARVISSGLHGLIFALDGITQETYQHFRRGGRLETALNGIRAVVDAKRAQGSARPIVNLRFIAMRHNEHEVPRLAEFGRELGVDMVTVKTLNPDPDCDAVLGEGESLLPRDPALLRFRYDTKGAPLRVKDNPCKAPWMQLNLHSDGLACPCSYDCHGKYVLGDLKVNSLREVWNGPSYAAFRRQFRRDWRSHPLCRVCSYAFQGGNCGTETVREA